MSHTRLFLHPVFQRFPSAPEPIDDPVSRLRTALAESGLLGPIKPGESVALAIGSRGINSLVPLVGTMVEAIRERGARPFILPAMGSHGGGTAEGQEALLCSLGISEKACGAPVVSSMEVVDLGRGTKEGARLITSRLALDADWVFPLVRIKTHTAFKGEIESGFLKMLAVGLGKEEGARNFHLYALRSQFPEFMVQLAKGIMAHLRIPAGVAVLEDAKGRPVCLEVVGPERFERTDRELLERYQGLAPGLPFDQADLLIVERMGKDISGTGMDPNVIGRTRRPIRPDPSWPKITRIWARSLTAASKGNATGIGLADFVSARLVREIDLGSTIKNSLSALCPENAFVPPVLEPERTLLFEAVRAAGVVEPGEARIAWIQDTGHLEKLLVSPLLAGSLKDLACPLEEGKSIDFQFDKAGNLTSFGKHWHLATGKAL
ncbi:MAG TPA: DUF362 domain-containing protein [archaeon]|nr:DUF362 domain-containing protein [archaeon]